MAVQILRQHFLDREDVVAWNASWNACPTRVVDLDALLLAHLHGVQAPEVGVEWTTKEGKEIGQRGRFRIGSYAIGKDNCTVFGCVDCDGGGRHGNPLADPLVVALQILKRCEQLGIPAYLEKSGGGAGWHVWLFFAYRAAAAKVRRLLFAMIPDDVLLADGGLADARANKGLEVFPKQDAINGDGLGNLVWLPWWHGAKEGGNQFYQVKDDGELATYVPETFQTVDEELLDAALNKVARKNGNLNGFTVLTTPPSDRTRAVEALHALNGSRAVGYDDWLRVGMALHSVDSSDSMLSEWDAWSKSRAPDKHEAGECAKKWASFSSNGRTVGLGSLIHWAKADGWKPEATYVCDENRKAHEGNGKAHDIGTNCTNPPPAKHAPFVPFPVDALPEPMRSYVVEGAKALGCDPAYLALPALSVAGVAAGTTRRLWLKRTWKEFPIFWTCVVGRSGSLKSPAFFAVMSNLYKIEKQLLKNWEAEYDKWEQEAAEWDAKAKKGKAEGQRPRMPCKPRLVTSDCTVESLAPMLKENPRGVLVSRDELRGWLASFAQYKKGGKGDDVQKWLEMYSGNGMVVDRRGGEIKSRTLFIERAAVWIAGDIQPGALGSVLTPELFATGLVARVWFAMPNPPRKTWTELEVDPQTEQRFNAAVELLLDLDFEPSADNECLPYLIHLTPEAKRIWVDYFNAIAGDQDATADDDTSASLAKLEGGAARLALAHHLFAEAGRGTAAANAAVTAESMTAGITLARWFAAESQRVYAVVRETDVQRDKRNLVEFIERRGGMTVRDLMRANNRRWPNAGAAEEELNRLVKAGVGEWRGEGKAKKFHVVSGG